jgi:aminomethyltransferase
VRDLADDDRSFIGDGPWRGRSPIKTSRWRTVGIIADWQDWNRVYNSRGLVPPKDHTPVSREMMLYDAKDRADRLDSQLLYSPMLQRHIGIARVVPATPGRGRSSPRGDHRPPLRHGGPPR